MIGYDEGLLDSSMEAGESNYLMDYAELSDYYIPDSDTDFETESSTETYKQDIVQELLVLDGFN